MPSIRTTAIVTFLCLIVGASAQNSETTGSGYGGGRSCEVEAVFQAPDGTYFSVERAVQHDNQGLEQWDSHVAHWSEWVNGFPVIDQDHNSLNRSVDVFPQSCSYVLGAMTSHEKRVVVAVECSGAETDKSPVTVNGKKVVDVILEYEYNNSSGGFELFKSQASRSYFPFIDEETKHRNLTFKRVLAMTYVNGPNKEDQCYIVHLWCSTAKDRNYFSQSWVTLDRKTATHSYELIADSRFRQYIPNLLHVKDVKKGSENNPVIEGAYGIWKHNQYDPLTRPWKAEPFGLWHLHDPLLGCPQNMCFDADVDAITNTPDGGVVVFRGCYFWTVKKSEDKYLPGRLIGARLIKSDWDKLTCNVWAAFFSAPDTIYIFQYGFFHKCAFSTRKCEDATSIGNVFKGVKTVSAATIDSQGRVWLLSKSDANDGNRFKYSVFRLSSSGGEAEKVVSQQFLQPKFPFLPEVVDDMMTEAGSIIFFTQSHFFRVKEEDMDRDDLHDKSVVPDHTPGAFYRCDRGLYATMASLGIQNVRDYYEWRKAPDPAPPMEQETVATSRHFNWLWLLLLLLLLIPICCFIPCRKSRTNPSDPQAPPESVFARSALGSVLSAIRPDNDLRSSMSTVPSDIQGESPNSTVLVKSRGPSRSKMSDTSSGRPSDTPHNASGASRSAMSNPSGGSRTPASGTAGSAPGSRSGMSGSPSAGPLSSSSRRSGLSNPSGGGPNSAASRSGMSGGSSGSPQNASSPSRSGLSNGSTGSSPNASAPSRSGLSNGSTGSSPNASAPSRSGLSNGSSGSSPNASAPSRSGLSNGSSGPSPNESARSRSGLSNGSKSGSSDNSKRSRMSNPSNK